MTTSRPHSSRRSLLGVAAGSALAAGALSVLVATAVAGAAGALGAALGAVIVVAFFGVGHAVLTGFRRIDPTAYLLIALLTYVLQIGCLLAVFASFAAWADGVSAPALGLTIIACTAAWTASLVMASRRERIPLFDLGEEAR